MLHKLPSADSPIQAKIAHTSHVNPATSVSESTQSLLHPIPRDHPDLGHEQIRPFIAFSSHILEQWTDKERTKARQMLASIEEQEEKLGEIDRELEFYRSDDLLDDLNPDEQQEEQRLCRKKAHIE